MEAVVVVRVVAAVDAVEEVALVVDALNVLCAVGPAESCQVLPIRGELHGPAAALLDASVRVVEAALDVAAETDVLEAYEVVAAALPVAAVVLSLVVEAASVVVEDVLNMARVDAVAAVSWKGRHKED